MARKFASGTLLLVGDRMPLLPARLDMLDDVTAEVALCEGRYHQVKGLQACMVGTAVRRGNCCSKP